MPTLTAARLNQALLTSSRSRRIKNAVHRIWQGVPRTSCRELHVLPLSLPKGSSLRPLCLCFNLPVPPPQPLTTILLNNSIPNSHPILIQHPPPHFSSPASPLNLKHNLSLT